MELIIAVLILALIVVTREYLVERAWRMDVQQEVDEWRNADRERWIAAEQAEDDALFAADAAKWGVK